MANSMKLVMRESMPSDRNFILATWLRGQRFGNLYFNEIPADIYFREYAQVIERTLSIPAIKIRIACDKENPEWIVGFSVTRGDILHWIHVKEDYRNKGIAKLLLTDLEIKTFKGFTRIGRAIAAKKHLIFNPF